MCYNILELEQTLKLAVESGARGFRVGIVMPCGNPNNMELSRSEIEWLNQSLDVLTKKHSRTIWIDREGVPRLKDKLVSQIRCGAGYNLITVCANGHIKPCEFLDENEFMMGDLLKEGPENIWKSPLMKYYRNLIF